MEKNKRTLRAEVTIERWDAYHKAAENAGLTISEWLRIAAEQLLSRGVKANPKTPAPPPPKAPKRHRRKRRVTYRGHVTEEIRAEMQRAICSAGDTSEQSESGGNDTGTCGP